jgi:septum formation protein
MHPLILASSSIYRKSLLERLKIPFTCYAPDIDESPLEGETIRDLVLRLSKEKSEICSQKHPEAACIGSDELAVINNEIVGKPGNKENAIKQLTLMSGEQVKFYTGVCISAQFLKHHECRLSITTLTFKKLTPSMIENYLEKEKPYHSAASFKSETLGSALIEKFECDDPTGIIGLPLIMLCDMLRNVGIDVV